MKSFVYAALLYLVLSLLVMSCAETPPEPECVSAEVIGTDCNSDWYILKISEDDSSGKLTNGYVGQLQGGYVTTDNLPEELRKAGTQVEVALEIYNDHGPRCLTVTVMYPAVKVKRVCSSKNKI
ncbi:hypothetical protein ACFSRY_03415 [Pontibacter locisalis]|uniref:Tissue inhibitor of metalloproteinase n=1 Tax=Pontibacter locisalis TaxID=1719035 RepID=A0ABW5ILL5_9BACT